MYTNWFNQFHSRKNVCQYTTSKRVDEQKGVVADSTKNNNQLQTIQINNNEQRWNLFLILPEPSMIDLNQSIKNRLLKQQLTFGWLDFFAWLVYRLLSNNSSSIYLFSLSFSSPWNSDGIINFYSALSQWRNKWSDQSVQLQWTAKSMNQP